jgi:hypothetical protein
MNPNLRKKLLKHSEEAHFFQLEDRNRISAQIGFCLGGLGLIANACVFYLNNLPSPLTFVTVFYWGILVGALTCGLFALYSFFHVLGFFAPNKYRILQSPRKIVSEIKELDVLATDDAKQLKLEEALEQKLMELYAEAAAFNECENERRKALLRKVIRWSIISLILVFINAFPFFYLKLTTPSTAQKVEISKPIKIQYERTGNQ